MKVVSEMPLTQGTQASLDGDGYALAVDPGTTTGWALFRPEGGLWRLCACGVGDPPQVPVEKLVIELPQVYPRQAVPPNDLISLAFLAGRIVGERWHVRDIRTVWPHEWKGNLPKHVSHSRIRAKLSREETHVLSACEALMKVRGGGGESRLHNVIDAIGIGFFCFLGV